MSFVVGSWKLEVSTGTRLHGYRAENCSAPIGKQGEPVSIAAAARSYRGVGVFR